MSTAYQSLWTSLEGVGRRPAGGYERTAWSGAEFECREWFAAAAAGLGMTVEVDRNGNLWAWWLTEDAAEPADSFVTGSHLDSVVGGGAYDGPLGVISGFAAVAALRASGVRLRRPVAVVAFSDEEGSRSGVACVGSRLLTGELGAARGLGLTDANGVSLADAMTAGGHDPSHVGRDDEALARIGVFVELHIEQGRDLVHRGEPVGLGTSIWPHGRWELRFDGAGNHAGTTALADRRDPLLALAALVVDARAEAAAHGSLATVGRITVEPNTANAIASRAVGWLDARSPAEATLDSMVEAIALAAEGHASATGVDLTIRAASRTPAVQFSGRAVDHLQAVLGALPAMSTGAGHDAGILAAHVPSAMLFVRNPTGVSHAPSEHADDRDCLAGVDALTAAMKAWIE